MKQKSDLSAEEKLQEDLTASPPAGDNRSDINVKKAGLESKCKDLLESVPEYEALYDAILAALAESHRQTLNSLQAELIQLKTIIPGLEKKSIKRLKLAGTLTSIDKQSEKMKLKATQKRKKDLNKMDDFTLDALRTLRALNRKIGER
jgi:hypothetical protein